MKKLLAIFTLSTILASTFFANAANIANLTVATDNRTALSEQITTVTFTPGTTTLTSFIFYYGTAITDTLLVSTDISANNTTGDIGAAVTAIDTGANSITFSADGANTDDTITLTFTNSHFATPATATGITFSIVTTDPTTKNIGSTQISVGESAKLSYFALVQPSLTFTVTKIADFASSTFTPGVTNTGASTITVGTNAGGGFTIFATNTGMKYNANEIGNGQNGETINFATPNLSAYGIRVAHNTGDAGSAAGTIQNSFGTTGTNYRELTGATESALVTVSGPAANATTTVTHAAIINNLQIPGDYTDTITYTVTATF